MSVDFGKSAWQLRTAGGAVSLRISRRAVAVGIPVALLTLAVSVVALATGELEISVGQVLRAFTGTAEGMAQTVVMEWRLPRVLMAVLFGAALGVSGGIFQSLTRNPLGSPDIIGFNTGAYTGALLVILTVGGGTLQVAGGALVGGLLTALAVYVLAFRRGIQGFRLIIVGIGVSAVLASVNHWIVLQAELEVAMSAAVWGAGSLNGISWDQALPAAGVIAVALVATTFVVLSMRTLALGDDAARALGVRAEPARIALVVLGVGLTAAVTAAAGPIAFVSLAAPQLARRMTGSAGIALLPSALVGALLLAASDLAAQRLFTPIQLPVGVVTVSIGGIYLIWLLAREARKS
ncbi:iron chelate uptake ABC transporter family permease subunit [Pseudarthrobacter sp. J75]|uniref:FecCD family ABC transporter permease n=1 Tax=unclassified Pseudarthrobacter TaxID=2647000 RepID=UPI002E80BAF3|nr:MULTISPECIES: iron chelate uptake ABC transporter family permease subunit [unclassified Pseudarthrobacter]MEE2522613.1 iron chelate uptake ABC transporter family permease subunit [Pseudarthrobacter sp. J47]MEE2530714.1 iron chelate uptake ABC transporter family permease subunit [Pseudarthrobacter sp. J75]MEE2571032.1 iron chelate uptake ABC transporter family permease subunit [Pseudarthrobacter sp. J64]